MRVGFLGSGPMTRAIGARLAAAGYEVVVGSRDARRAEEVAAGMGASVTGADHRVAASCEVVVVAVHDPVAIETVAGLRDLLAGAVLIDLGNPLDPPHWESRLAGGPSLAERIAEAAPSARVVKAFNTVYAELLALPAPAGAPAPQTFVASDDEAAKSLVMDLARSIGTDPLDAGPLRMSRHLEAVAGFEVALTARGFADAVAVRFSPA
ncbi:NAD(P)-binding domain-containing protein [Leifsonia sp. NPDC080035]|uniref:NAD(P)-binding domain-containing protein n=1 Tax=Leifsonia sp. NPDC080035 TaxID=3143936 RepID=A0AAU7GIT6_9MICO